MTLLLAGVTTQMLWAIMNTIIFISSSIFLIFTNIIQIVVYHTQPAFHVLCRLLRIRPAMCKLAWRLVWS